MSSSPPPQPGRPTVSLAQAAKLLGKDWRTVKRLVENGDLDGGATLEGKRPTYYVYADQLLSAAALPASQDASSLLDTIAGLHQELEQSRAAEAHARESEARARAAAAATEETNRLLQANQAILLGAVQEFQHASDAAAALVDDYRALTDRHWSMAGQYRDAATGFAKAADNYQDILGRLLTPDDASSLTQPND
ncbi:hypothetical protein MycrhDRAFT_6245 [Mycolicibacterium rhodesiae JS60]|nr:hypothetical protein MycrhDRAFT_6245 [Mycolicibacterium rhodesiae JS60]